MQGWSATILLLTLATFLDELLHLAGILSSEHTSKPHSSHLIYPSSSPQARPPTLRWWPIHAAAGSPVTEPESQIKPIISQVEQRTSEIIHNGDAHATQTRWAMDDLDMSRRQMERLRLLEVEEVRPGSNAPMGWADPRLRGGQMLDVSVSLFHLAHIPFLHHRTCLIHLVPCSKCFYIHSPLMY
jgi:hypothetical protein